MRGSVGATSDTRRPGLIALSCIALPRKAFSEVAPQAERNFSRKGCNMFHTFQTQ